MQALIPKPPDCRLRQVRPHAGGSATDVLGRVNDENRYLFDQTCRIKAIELAVFKTAIDDIGAGYSGLNLLAEFQPDLIKLDMELTRGIDSDPVRQAIVRAIIGVCLAMQIEIVAEGIETEAEYALLNDMGVHYMQGYWFARPAYEQLPAVRWPQHPAA